MREFTNMTYRDVNVRQWLLATTSAAVLLVATTHARAEDADSPPVWIEFGGQVERADNRLQYFSPPFVAAIDALPFTPIYTVQIPPKYAYGAQGGLSFSPDGSDWIFAASIRYGRASGHRHLIQATPVYLNVSGHIQTAIIPDNANATGRNDESYAVLDFQSGKDVGLGMFGGHENSVVNLGVRIAQFASKAHANISAVPDFYINPHKYDPQHHHRYVASSNIKHDFHGIGPSLSWDASTAVSGSSPDGAISLDWGLNAALLFGRQEVKGTHRTESYYQCIDFIKFLGHGCPAGTPTPAFALGIYTRSTNAVAVNRTHSVIVPNLGGFAGLSYRYSDAKLSLGYRADFFFGAMDGGIDTRKSTTRGFFGPFASISVGIGD